MKYGYFETNAEIVTSGEKRRYLLHVPDSLDPETEVPLVIVLHGLVQSPAHQQYMSRWDDLADQEGFITAYPMGTGIPFQWNSHVPVELSEATRKDVAFLTDLIDDLSAHHRIDPRRIYVSGMSNGAGMAFVLTCTLADRIAAVGGVAGFYTYPWEACKPARPVPMIAFHGVEDRIVPYHGAATRMGQVVPDVPSWVAEYARRNGCGEEVEQTTTDSVQMTRYTGCQAEADVVLYTVADGGHAWPGGEPLPRFIAGPTSTKIDATRVTWEFFKSHPLPLGWASQNH